MNLLSCNLPDGPKEGQEIFRLNSWWPGQDSNQELPNASQKRYYLSHLARKILQFSDKVFQLDMTCIVTPQCQ